LEVPDSVELKKTSIDKYNEIQRGPETTLSKKRRTKTKSKKEERKSDLREMSIRCKEEIKERDKELEKQKSDIREATFILKEDNKDCVKTKKTFRNDKSEVTSSTGSDPTTSDDSWSEY
jgi:hypothetical protein